MLCWLWFRLTRWFEIMEEMPETLGGYVVERELGRGGMGVVYLARDPRLDRLVAIKALNEELGSHPERLARFEREARTLASINNPNIAIVYGMDEELGRQLLVMEYVPGHNLSEHIKRAGPLAPAEAYAICVQIASGLEGAHETGIVHRDLKPANVRVREDGVVKVLDFGLAKPEADVRAILGDNDETLSMAPTAEGRIMGTAGYMSPEQARGRPVDKRADIWSFGAVLFECLSGTRAFGGETAMDAMVAILEKDPPWEKLPSAAGAGVIALVRRCLEKDPKKRLRDVGDARIELEQLLSDRSRPDPRRFLAGASFGEGRGVSGRSDETGSATGSLSGSSGGFASTLEARLPADLSSFIGRAGDLDRLEAMLDDARLVTLAGAGGCGKSRLAIEVARRSADRFRDSVWTVDLAAVEDPEVIGTEIAGAFGLPEVVGRPAEEVLAESLADRELLLVVDNCEHLGRDLATLLQRLLAVSPGLRVMVTTREAFGIPGEWVYRVGVLGVPPAGEDDLEAIGSAESVRLFVERARLVKPGFVLGAKNAVAVATICRELDGVPLALELAAARMKLLGPDQIAERLHDRFKLLRSRSGDPRQQTLLAAIEWSYEQLEPVERIALQRLSVFRGGATLAAAESVLACDGDWMPDAIESWEVLDLIEHLVDKSLVAVEEPEGSGVAGETRYRVLESIRQYGYEALAASPGFVSAREAHAAWVARFSAKAEGQLMGGDQTDWFARLEDEQGNIRAALEFVFDEPSVERVELGRVIGAGVWRYWAGCGRIAEGRRLLLRLDRVSDGMEPTAAWARVREGISSIATATGDLVHAVAYGRAGLELARYTCADRGDTRTVGGLLACLGAACLGDGIPARARDYYEESLEIRRSMGDRVRVSESLCGLALCAVQLGALPEAEGLLRDAEQTLRGAGGGLQLAQVHAAYGEYAIAAGRASEAARRLEEAGRILTSIGAMTGVPWILDLLACVAVERGEHERAVRLSAAAARGRDRLACPARPSETIFCERFTARADDEVGDERRVVLVKEGRAMPMRRALRYAKGEG